jgi:hypothetical protein
MGYRTSASGGVIDTVSWEHIPSNESNRRWREYLAFVAGGGTTDPVETLALSTYKARAQSTLDGAAERERQKHLRGYPGEALWLSQRYDEARRCVDDSAPNQTAANYPLMDAEIPETAATVALVAAAVNTERAATMVSLADIEDVRRSGAAAITASTTNAEVDSALAAVVWP